MRAHRLPATAALAVHVACAALLGLAALLAAPPAGAATRDFYFQRLGSDHGLVQNTVTALAQDADGFVWVGTQGGLHRFDGQRYALFRHDPRDPASLPDSYVTGLATEGADALWVGTHGEYVARLDLATGLVRRYATDDMDAPARHARALLAHGGAVWVATSRGLERLDPGTGRRTAVVPLGEAAGMGRQALLADPRGGLWYASPGGLFKVPAQGAPRRIGPAEPVMALARDRQGRVWLGRRDGLYRLHSDGRSLIPEWVQPAELPGGPVRAIVQAPDDRLWLAVGFHGLRRLDPASGHIDAIAEAPAISASLPENGIETLMVDRGGILWVGGQLRGVSVTDPMGARFRYVIDDSSGRLDAIISNNSIRALQHGRDGRLWVGTDDGRLLRYDMDADRFDDWSTRLPRRARVMAIAPAGHDRLWLGTAAGLMRLDATSGDVEAMALGAYAQAGIRALATDHQGDLWLGTTDSGLLHVRRQGGQVVAHAIGDDTDRPAPPAIHALLRDGRGRIWVATSDGLGLLDPASGRVRHFRRDANAVDALPGNLVRAVHQSRDGSIWVGTHTGLARVVEAADGRVTFQSPLIEALPGVPTPVVFSILEDAAGTLWMGTNAGLVSYRPDTGHARQYGLADGLQDLEFNGGAAATLADGQMAFGGVRGINLFHPTRLRESAFVPPLKLLTAQIGAHAMRSGEALWRPETLSLPNGAELLRLRIGALDYTPGARIRYRYRLDGFDSDWIDNGEQSDITYTQLPPGRYTFRAQSGNHDGVWSGTDLVLPVHVAPPPWRHPLAIAAAVLALLAAASTAGWRWHRRRRLEQGWFRQIREREERLKLALWASGEQFWDYDLKRRELHGMRAHDEEHGGTPELTVHAHVASDHEIHPDDLPQVTAQLREHLRGHAALFLSEHRVRNPEGGWDWIRARGRVVERDEHGHPLRVAGTARDITASRSAERDRRISTEVLRSMAEAVAVFDSDFTFVSVNPAFEKMTGHTAVDVIGRPTSMIDSGQHDPDFYHQMRAQIHRNGRWSGEIWQQRHDGSEFLCWLQCSAVHDTGGAAKVQYVAVLTDITDQKRAEQELRYLANYDTLTSLPNRTLLSERLSRAIVRARREQPEGRGAVPRPGPLQGHQRLAGPCRRRPHPARGRAAPAGNRRQPATRSRGWAATNSPWCWRTSTTRSEAEDVARDIILAFEAPLDFDERHDIAISPVDRHQPVPGPCAGAHRPAQAGRHRDVPGQGRRAAAPTCSTPRRWTIEIRRRATISAALAQGP